MPAELTQEQIRAFVLPAHGDLARVKELLAEDPRLLDACYEEWSETALGAASHVGNREIAEFLLSKGAKLTIYTAAMLGKRHEVEVFLISNPSLVNSGGAHGISLLYHTAIGGNTDIANLLVAHGNTQNPDHPLQAAVANGRLDMVKWLLGRGANVNTTDWQGKSPLQVATERGDQTIVELLSRQTQ